MTTSTSKRLAAVAIVTCIFASGCAHQTTVTSTNPGAEVYVEGELIGRTPVDLDKPTGHISDVHFDVRQNGESKRFAVKQDSVDGMAMLGAIGVGLASIGAGFTFAMASSVMLVLSVAVIQVNAPAGLAMVAGSTGLLFLGTLVSSLAITLPINIIGEFGYALPDRVDVDWVSGEVLLEGGGAAQPLIGVPEGYEPHRPKSENGYE